MARADPAGTAWELLLELLLAQRSRLPRVAAEFGLSPVQAHALQLLEPGQPTPMGALAQALACDNSNVTGIVDRLEARGVLERRSVDGDRRVRLLVVTEEGGRLRARLFARLAEPPTGIRRLSRAEQETLAELLRRALAAEPPPRCRPH